VKALGRIVLGAAALGAISTLGDLIWALWLPRHQVHWGILHGALLCWFLGLVLGSLAIGRRAGWRMGLWELGVGSIAAGSFYLLAPWLGWGAMFVSWMVLWLLTALVLKHLEKNGESAPMAFGRGALAAVLSGFVFYLISGIWTDPEPGGPNYLVHFGAWSLAFLPGFAALLFRRAYKG